MTNVYYGKTRIGQLLYDLCFHDLSEKWLARKHRLPIAEVRRLKVIPSMRKLRKQIRCEKLEGE